jgi:hypothetical protein
MRAVKSGIATPLLVSQVRATAGWLWEDPRAVHVTRALDDIEGAERDRKTNGVAYMRALFAAHFATVATFVPTDVDTRIRHHAWEMVEDPAVLSLMLDELDAVAALDPRWVSARTVDDATGQPLSGHDGEWFSVRAGALGRAGMLGDDALVSRLEAAIDDQLQRHARTFEEALAQGAPARRLLALATILGHNLGDLSRVVEAWPKKPELARLRTRYARLGHPDAPEPVRAFVVAGALNKAIMALENHRFLFLRKPRALRASRALLLPIGPWFDAWGESVARTVEESEVPDVVAALLETHLSSPDQQGVLRALAGIHRATRGGLELHVPSLPARLRKDAMRGRVREALDITPEHFEAKVERRLANERAKVGA